MSFPATILRTEFMYNFRPIEMSRRHQSQGQELTVDNHGGPPERQNDADEGARAPENPV